MRSKVQQVRPYRNIELLWISCSIWNQYRVKEFCRLRAHLHDTTVVHDCSFWCIRFTRKSLHEQLQHSRANSKQEFFLYDIIAYTTVVSDRQALIHTNTDAALHVGPKATWRTTSDRFNVLRDFKSRKKENVPTTSVEHYMLMNIDKSDVQLPIPYSYPWRNFFPRTLGQEDGQ